MAAELHYLTVQDMLWANLQVSKTVNGYHYANLEEATFYQYGYGSSRDLLAQAARLLPGFVRMAPFDKANEATAFVGTLAFLELNGKEITLGDKDGESWFRAALADPADKISGVVRAAHGHDHAVSVREAIASVVGRYPQTISSLLNATAPV